MSRALIRCLTTLTAAACCVGFASAVGAEEAPYVFQTPHPAWTGAHSRFAVVDRNGKLLFRGDPRHEPVDEDFKHGFLRIRAEGKEGLIDSSGKVVIQPRFHEVKVMPKGTYDADAFASTSVDFQSGTCVDRSGQELIPPRDKHSIGCPIEGLALTRGPRDPAEEMKCKPGPRPIGFVDRKGEFVIALGRFQDLGEFNNGNAPAKLGAK